MSSVDNRIVNMQFNNQQFQAGAAESIKSLNDLEQTIGSMGNTAGLDSMGSSVDEVASRFSALQIIGVSALATLASKATSAALDLGKNLLGSITDTILGAGKDRAIALEQAKFQFRGLGLDVEKTMASALEAVKGTAYGLQEAATLAAQFGGSGIKAGKEMTGALRGVSGIAAQTGRSYSEIGQVVAGIAGVGRVTTQDLMQFGVRGLNVAAAMAKQLGKTEQEVRLMVSNGEISFPQFAKLMDKAFGKNATKANETYTGSLANVKAALSRIGADIAAPRLEALKNIFNALTPVIDKVHEALMPLFNTLGKAQLKGADAIVKFLGDLKVNKILGPLLEGFQNILAPFKALFQTIGDAWREVFPSTGGGSDIVYKLADAFQLLTTPLAWIADLIPHLAPLFVAFFSAIKIGVTVISAFVSSLSELAQKGKAIGTSIIDGILSGFDGNAIKNQIINFANSIVEWIKGALGIHSPAAELVPVGEAIVLGIAQGIHNMINYIGEAMKKIIGAIFAGIGDLFGGMNAFDWSALFNALLTGGLLLTLRGLAKSLKGFSDTLKGSVDTLLGPFSQMTNTLKTMQTEIKSRIIKTIAISVGILTASLIALSFLNPKKIATGLGALAGIMAQLVGAMAVLGKINPEGLVAMGAAILQISIGIGILSGAIAILGNLGLDTLAKGLGAMAIALGIMVVALKGMTGLGAGLPAAAAAILIMAAAMNVMSTAILALGNMSLETLAKGLGAIAIGLAIFTAALIAITAVGPGAAAAGAGILIVAAAMSVMAGAIGILGSMNLSTLAKGLGAMAIGLTAMVVAIGALTLLGPTVIVSAQAIILVAGAMLILANALKIIGNLSLAQIAAGLGTMAVALALVLAAGAVAISIAPGLIVLGAAVFALGAGAALAGAGMLAAATAFSLLAAVGAAGVSVLVVAINALLALLPTFAFQAATALVVFVETIASLAPRLRVALGEILANVLGTIQDAIPRMQELGTELINALLRILEKAIPKVGNVIQAYITMILKVLRNSIPQIADTALAIVQGILDAFARRLPAIIQSGVDIIVAFIRGIGKAALQIAEAAGQTILDFIHGLTAAINTYAPQIRAAGLELAIAIIDGLTGGILTRGIGLVTDAMRTLASHLPGPFKKILGIESPSKEAHYWGEMIVAGLVNGITNNIRNAVGATIALANAVVAAGDKVVAKAQKESSKKQIAAEKLAAKALVSEKIAKDAERVAKKSPKNKALEKQAEDARRFADKQAKAADKAQKVADAAAQKVSDVQQFRAADDTGKGDILTQRAKDLSDKAIKALAKANAEAQAAKKLQGKERKELLKKAREDAKAAKDLADRSKAANQKANEYYAKSVRARIKALEDAKAAKAEQEAFDASTPAQQAAILKSRADDAQKRSEAAFKASEALVKRAQKLAKTDARKAQRLLDRAEKLADKASQAASDAQNYSEQSQNATSNSNSPNFQLSKSVLEDAASAIDRYTESLQLAEQAAAAAPPVYQFTQNNTSPEALSEAEIYRQSKNLLSAAEIKMGVTGP